MTINEGPQSGSTSTRDPNFTDAQDVLLCSAWSHASIDDTTGTDPNGTTFWKKAHAYWLKNKEENFPDRNDDALMQRFSRIKTAVSKFCEHFSKVQSLSGFTEVDKIAKARLMYSQQEAKENAGKKAAPKKVDFKFEHCWNLLRNDPKWLEVTKEKPMGSEVVVRNTSENVDAASSSLHDVVERPDEGKKNQNEGRTKKRRKILYDSSSLLERIDQSRARNEKVYSEIKAMCMEHDKKMDGLLELKKEKLELQKKKFEMDEKQTDTNLMMIDTSSFSDPLQLQYFQMMRKDITDKYLRRKGII